MLSVISFLCRPRTHQNISANSHNTAQPYSTGILPGCLSCQDTGEFYYCALWPNVWGITKSGRKCLHFIIRGQDKHDAAEFWQGSSWLMVPLSPTMSTSGFCFQYSVSFPLMSLVWAHHISASSDINMSWSGGPYFKSISISFWSLQSLEWLICRDPKLLKLN